MAMEKLVRRGGRAARIAALESSPPRRPSGQVSVKSSQQKSGQSLIIACGALGREVMTLLRQSPEGSDQVDVQCLPAHFHNTPEQIAPGVEAILKENRKHYKHVLVAYGECGTAGELDKVLKTYDAERIPGAHCYEFYAGSTLFESIVEDEVGSFYVTDYLVKNFRKLVFESLGLHNLPHLRDIYFGHYRQMVYLAQTQDKKLITMAEEAADSVSLKLIVKQVGYGDLEHHIESVAMLKGIPIVVKDNRSDVSE